MEICSDEDEESEVEISSDEEQWCPPNPDPPADPTEEELSGAAERPVLVIDSGSEVFACFPEDGTETSLLNCLLMRYEMPDLDWIVVM